MHDNAFFLKKRGQKFLYIMIEQRKKYSQSFYKDKNPQKG